MNPAQYGRDAESRAARYLAARGFRILGRNVRGPGGEVDILAIERETLVVVEVKARTGAAFGSAASSIGPQKRRRLRTLAADFLQFSPRRMKVRFDVVAIDGDRFEHIRGAFA